MPKISLKNEYILERYDFPKKFPIFELVKGLKSNSINKLYLCVDVAALLRREVLLVGKHKCNTYLAPTCLHF